MAIIEAEVCPDHIHMLLEIPPKIAVSSFVGYLKGKSSLMIYEQFPNLKYKYRNREFWCRVYYVDTVGKNAKTPLKVHLRLRFQNLGKPRTAGLCGRAAGACDCGPLSCYIFERPLPLEKPSCKVRLSVQNRSRKYRQKVTATMLFQTASHPVFQLLSQTAHGCFHG